ncbi:sensor domain-containing diguanylate cyclase [Acetoanaerobium noterae]|uniref:sensor domain-containing diguanylate cyclase n=1 Tax=Acetoanaerobium noterae TaxID=745369 RepID=UPI0028A6C81F|nr:sensor domain-containing diguanylate cyclase [Acetoanaerobium noterae]
MRRILSVIFLVGLYWLNKFKKLNKTLSMRQKEFINLNDKVIDSEKLYKSIFDASPDAIVMFDINYRILIASKSANEVLGFEGDCLVGENILQFFVDKESKRIEKNIRRVFNENNIGTTNYRGKKNNNSTIYEVNSRAIKDENGNSINLVSIIRDVTQKVILEEVLEAREKQYKELAKELERKNISLSERVSIDNLTGIKNRYYFDERIKEEVDLAKRQKVSFSLLLFDLDHFKLVNDNFGHDIGDKVLKRVTDAVSKIIRSYDIFARWGGEEFVVLMPNTTEAEAVLAAEKIRKAVEDIIHPDIEKITISIGIAIWEVDDDVDQIFVKADKALYTAKNQGRNRVIVYKKS